MIFCIRSTITVTFVMATVAQGQTPGTPASAIAAFRQQLLKDASVSNVAFAPAGDAIAYSQTRPLEATRDRFGDRKVSDLWIATAPDWKPRQLATPADRATQLSGVEWSPDGSKLAFFRTEGVTAQVMLWTRRSNAV